MVFKKTTRSRFGPFFHLLRIQQTKVVGLRSAAIVVHQVTGFSGFFQGLSARVLYQAPSTAVSWTVYEFFKFYMREKKEVKKKSSTSDYDTIDELRAAPPVVN
jgi:hypothetical protein